MEFVDTKHMTAEEKHRVYAALSRFIDSGFERKKFTKALYAYLMQNFGFIAHYNQSGFWHTRFNDPAGRLHTMEQIVATSRWAFVEDTERTWDLNRAVRDLISERSAEFTTSAFDKRVKQLLTARTAIDRELHSYGIDPNITRPSSETGELPAAALLIEALGK